MRLKLGIGQGEGRIRPPVEDRGVPGSPSKEMNDLYSGQKSLVDNTDIPICIDSKWQ